MSLDGYFAGADHVGWPGPPSTGSAWRRGWADEIWVDLVPRYRRSSSTVD